MSLLGLCKAVLFAVLLGLLPGGQAAWAQTGEAVSLPPAIRVPFRELPKAPIDLAQVLVLPPPAWRIPAKHDVERIGERGVGRGFNLYSKENETQWGQRIANAIEDNVRLLKDPVVTDYINRLGQNLARHSDSPAPFTIKVIDDDEVNAVALPGGFFYVNVGLILAAENEAELAGVMAHEIAHVAARHATKAATRSEVMNLLTIPLMFVGGPAGMVVRQVWALAVPMSALRFGRGAEREADLLGLQYQYASGYDPQEFVRFFEKLGALEKKKKQGLLAKAFSTHPMTGERIKRAQKEIVKWLPPEQQYIVDTSEFQNVKARLLELRGQRQSEAIQWLKPTLRQREK